MKEQILRLDPHDDVNSARDKMGWTQAARVLLVWPPAGRVLRRRLDLVLLARHAQAMGARLGIVCDDDLVREHAQALGLPAFHCLEDSHRRPWPRPRAVRLAAPPISERAPIAPRPVPRPFPIRLNLPAPLIRVLSFHRPILFLGGLLAVAALAAFLYPSATVRLTPVPQTIAVEMPMVADPAVEAADPMGTLPARSVGAALEASARIATTGVKDVPSSKASGTVVFTNLVGTAASIPAGTSLRTTSGTTVRFQTTGQVEMAARRGYTAIVPIVAVDAGPQGNVAAGQINAIDGPLGLQLAVVNEQPTTGGGMEQRAAVSPEDRDRLREMLLAQLTQDAIARLTDSLAEHERMPAESVRITRIESETYDRYPGEQADTLALTLRVQAEGLAVDLSTAESIVLEALSEQVPDGYVLIPGSPQVKWLSEPAMDGEDRIRLEVAASGQVAAQIQPEEVRSRIRGLSPDAAAKTLAEQLPLASPAAITLAPDWFPRLPWLEFRILVEVQTGAMDR